jgi:hypothetical protein
MICHTLEKLAPPEVRGTCSRARTILAIIIVRHEHPNAFLNIFDGLCHERSQRFPHKRHHDLRECIYRQSIVLDDVIVVSCHELSFALGWVQWLLGKRNLRKNTK